MSRPHRHFRIGDLVRYETSMASNLPRWNLNHDNGGSGIFKHGKIVKADKTFAYLLLHTGTDYVIPQPNKEVEYLWENPGFYELIEADDEKPAPKKLEYSMKRRIDPSCDCGKERSGASMHYSWCSMMQ